MLIPANNQTVLQGCFCICFVSLWTTEHYKFRAQMKAMWALPLSLKSSTRMISAIRLSGVRLMMLWMVRRSDVQPSLWNGMMMLVLGSVSKYTLCLQLQRQGNNRISTLEIWVGISCHPFGPFNQHVFWHKIQQCNQAVLSCENSWTD